MRPQHLIPKHQLPCGPMTVKIDGVCRRRLRDEYDAMLDRLTRLTHPEGRDAEEDDDPDQMFSQEETLKEKKDRMLTEGKMKLDVKKELKKYEEKVMPPSQDHVEDKLQGNSKLLQRIDGKMPGWRGKG